MSVTSTYLEGSGLIVWVEFGHQVFLKGPQIIYSAAELRSTGLGWDTSALLDQLAGRGWSQTRFWTMASNCCT